MRPAMGLSMSQGAVRAGARDKTRQPPRWRNGPTALKAIRTPLEDSRHADRNQAYPRPRPIRGLWLSDIVSSMGHRPRAKAARRGPAGDGPPDGHRPPGRPASCGLRGACTRPRGIQPRNGSASVPPRGGLRPHEFVGGLGRRDRRREDIWPRLRRSFVLVRTPPRPPVPGGCGGGCGSPARAAGAEGAPRRPPRAADPPRPRGGSGPVGRRSSAGVTPRPGRPPGPPWPVGPRPSSGRLHAARLFNHSCLHRAENPLFHRVFAHFALGKAGGFWYSKGASMRLLGQRPRYQEGPPEGAGSVRSPPLGAVTWGRPPWGRRGYSKSNSP